MNILSRKILPTIIILFLAFSPLGEVFVNKAEALSPGEAVGKAVGAGAACFLASRIENFVASLLFGELPATGAAAIKGGTASSLSLVVAEALSKTTMVTNVPVLSLAEFHVQASVAISNLGVLQSVEAMAYKDATTKALGQSKDCIRDVVAKIILDWIVDETIKWIQGGGKPAYVTDWKKFGRDALNVGVGEVVSATKLAPLCSPFKLQVHLSLLPVERYTQRISCTLDDIVGNIEDFYNDFSKGGWLAYSESWRPQNNYYGVMLMYHDEALKKAMEEAENARNEAMSGKGFLSVKRCKGGGLTAEEKALEDFHGSGNYVKDSRGNFCLRKDLEIITPGDVVGEAVRDAVTSDTVWAANIKSWVASLINAVINRLIREGLSLMKGSGDSRPAGYGDFDPYHGNNPATQVKKDYVNKIISDYKEIQSNSSNSLVLKNQSLSTAQQLLTVLNELKAKNCQPAVTESEINNLKNEIEKLKNEVASIQNAFYEANNNLSMAQGISQYNDAEVLLVEKTYNEFLGKYGEVTTSAYLNDSQKELESKKADLISAQNKLNACI